MDTLLRMKLESAPSANIWRLDRWAIVVLALVQAVVLLLPLAWHSTVQIAYGRLIMFPLFWLSYLALVGVRAWRRQARGEHEGK